MNMTVASPENVPICLKGTVSCNTIALRMAKTLWSFGHSECNKVKHCHTKAEWM